jgi:DNA-binding response OmpR family regulator
MGLGYCGAVSGIVIIEKDDLLRGLLAEWLSAEGYVVRERRLRELPAADRADLVIVDLYMPRQAGHDIVRAVKQAHPGAAVIAISAQFRAGLDGSWRAAQALGAQRLIAKPFTRAELLEAVRAVIGVSALSPPIR